MKDIKSVGLKTLAKNLNAFKQRLLSAEPFTDFDYRLLG